MRKPNAVLIGRARLVQRQLERDVAEFGRNVLAVQRALARSRRGPCRFRRRQCENPCRRRARFRPPSPSPRSAPESARSRAVRVTWNSSLRSSYSRCSVSCGISSVGLTSLRRQARQREAAIFRGAEQIGMFLVKLRQLGLARRRRGAGDGGNRNGGRCRRRASRYGGRYSVSTSGRGGCNPAGHRLQQIVARDFLAHPRHELVLGDPVHHQHLREQAAVKLAVRSAKGRVFDRSRCARRRPARRDRAVGSPGSAGCGRSAD